MTHQSLFYRYIILPSLVEGQGGVAITFITMSIPYSLALRQIHPGEPEMGNKTYPVAQVRTEMNLSDMAKHMSSHSSMYD